MTIDPLKQQAALALRRSTEDRARPANFFLRRLPDSPLATDGGSVFPAFLKAPHDAPGCYHHFFRSSSGQFAGRTPNVQSIGISYMYGGKWTPKTHAMGIGSEFHVGAHIMIIGPDQKMMQTFNQNG